MTTTWTIAEVARLSGVTSRTLRHYHAVGLLVPPRTGAGGVRLYGEAELLRLQQILLLRELGVGLPAIRQVVDGESDPVRLLRDHRERLLGERKRLAVLAETVRKTIQHLEEGAAMSPEEMFAGYDPAKQEAYEREIRARYGDTAIDESKRRDADRRARGKADPDWSGFDRLAEALAEHLRAGTPPADDAVDRLIAEWYRIVEQAWTPDRESFTGLGQLYVDAPDFRTGYERRQPGLAEYLRDAMAAYATRHLH